jgi:hypothetical protein
VAPGRFRPLQQRFQGLRSSRWTRLGGAGPGSPPAQILRVRSG